MIAICVKDNRKDFFCVLAFDPMEIYKIIFLRHRGCPICIFFVHLILLEWDLCYLFVLQQWSHFLCHYSTYAVSLLLLIFDLLLNSDYKCYRLSGCYSPNLIKS